MLHLACKNGSPFSLLVISAGAIGTGIPTDAHLFNTEEGLKKNVPSRVRNMKFCPRVQMDVLAARSTADGGVPQEMIDVIFPGESMPPVPGMMLDENVMLQDVYNIAVNNMDLDTSEEFQNLIQGRDIIALEKAFNSDEEFKALFIQFCASWASLAGKHAENVGAITAEISRSKDSVSFITGVPLPNFVIKEMEKVMSITETEVVIPEPGPDSDEAGPTKKVAL